MTANDWLVIVAFGSMFGALGQLVRAVPGLKKMMADPAGKFDAMRFIISLMLGAVAGALAAILLVSKNSLFLANLNTQVIFTLMGAGYAGSDFIEGFMAKAAATPTVKQSTQ